MIPEDVKRWETEIRDPARAAIVETQQYRRGQEFAEYELAEIPGGWTWRARTSYATGASADPWCRVLLPTADEARSAALRWIRRRFIVLEDSKLLAALPNPDQHELEVLW